MSNKRSYFVSSGSTAGQLSKTNHTHEELSRWKIVATGAMPDRFGDLLRNIRKKRGKTLDHVAHHIGVSAMYISHVERGHRKPLSNDRIVQIASFLGSDPTDLINAADRERIVAEYDIQKARPLEADVIGGLLAGLARGGITDEQLHRIQKILNMDPEEDGPPA